MSTWIEVEMKKFRLVSNLLTISNGRIVSKELIVKADSYADVIQEIESNAGWFTADNGAVKVAYIEEIKE